ncbi:hypothetical protein H0B56_12205 [Haloechinothrix sp. YIM 98757]|uniref:Helix-turn-helix domain-containing protein n=1 Tax=Haloechinothrix aidingensis TaxID=2752311 RepID=A0A838AAQ8_9PSEU|nr:helix-turn-helix domain-containing protein [Haloechinothrix aidingensis]MBA0126305.1 hypothetical protein [Haloechinothrix aidingensis]
MRRVVLPVRVKFLALILATYADPDGSRVRPGLDVLASVSGQSERSVKRSLAELRGLGLLTVARRGGGRGGQGRTTEHQLTIPVDLLDRVTVLDPDERPQSQATQVASRSSSSTPDEPVDNSNPEATQMAPESEAGDAIERPHSDHPEAIGRPKSTIGRPPGWPTTTHIDHPPTKTMRVETSQGESLPRARAPDHDPQSLPQTA